MDMTFTPVATSWSVSVDSSGYSADWIDILVVIAFDEAQAKFAAEAFITEHYPLRTVNRDHTEAYPLTGSPARVVGRLINTDEE